MFVGLAAGLGIAYFWPHEPAYATTADRDSGFVMVTIPVGTNVAGITDAIDGVFILDFATSRLRGAVLNRQTGKFANFYEHELAPDFKLEGNRTGRYTIATGYAPLAGQGGIAWAAGIIYVAELNSGKCVAYAFPWTEVPRVAGPIQLIKKDEFEWREPNRAPVAPGKKAKNNP
jgi:hypothetical protein